MQYTRPATWADVKTIARYFAEAGVEYALIGGYAVAAHGFNRFSEDIDLLVNPTVENSRRWISALARLPDGAANALTDNPDVFAGGQQHAIRINDEFTIDILPQAGGASWATLRPHIIETQIDGQTVRLLDLEGLLQTKQGARPRDQMDAAVIRAALQAMREQ
ncbi:MAG: hypothetical protein KDI32_04065 [Pseudomonadales bacterium]|jgi:hypothetical protein|nr:hypothetical protein [Pseudomonadales bacterium]